MPITSPWRADFPGILALAAEGQTYLDSAATAQKPQAMLDSLLGYYTGGAANVHRAQHLPGERATRAFEATRDKAARWLNAASREEIVFTRGTTESLNLLAYGLEPLFQSHMWDGSAVPVEENLAIADELLALTNAAKIVLEIEVGVVGGEEDGVENEINDKLFTSDEDFAKTVDALGADKVRAVMMPSPYTAQMSLDDSREMVRRIGVRYDEIAIEPAMRTFADMLAPQFAGLPEDTTEENLQSRIRGMLLMALSNKTGAIVLTTGNKSEMAVGYATLYGDMAGGFDVLKDVPKTLVFKLCEYRNSVDYVIPQRVIDRPPSAELAPDQVDQDSLPPYDILDAILKRYVEEDASVADMVAEGFEEAVVRKVIRLVDLNEYKRRQAAVGPRITARNFGKDRRYPITSGFGKQNW